MATKTTKKPTAKKTRGAKKTTSKTSPKRPRARSAEKPTGQLRRTYKGRELVIDVVDGGYVFEGESYSSLSALAKHIVGYGISGPNFFKTSTKPSEAE